MQVNNTLCVCLFHLRKKISLFKASYVQARGESYEGFIMSLCNCTHFHYWMTECNISLDTIISTRQPIWLDVSMISDQVISQIVCGVDGLNLNLPSQ